MWYWSCYKENWRIRKSQGQKQNPKNWKAWTGRKHSKCDEKFLRVCSWTDQKKFAKDLTLMQTWPSTVWRSFFRKFIEAAKEVKDVLILKKNSWKCWKKPGTKSGQLLWKNNFGRVYPKELKLWNSTWEKEKIKHQKSHFPSIEW